MFKYKFILLYVGTASNTFARFVHQNKFICDWIYLQFLWVSRLSKYFGLPLAFMSVHSHSMIMLHPEVWTQRVRCSLQYSVLDFFLLD